MQMFGIGEIARRAGVATSTIRYYEHIALLPPSRRVSGKRRYDTTVLQKLRLIRLAQQAGYTIAEIQMLLHDFPSDTPPAERWRTLARTKLVEVDELMQKVQARKLLLEQTLHCACATLEDCAAVDEDGITGEVVEKPGVVNCEAL